MVRAAGDGVDAATGHAFNDFGVRHLDFENEVDRDACGLKGFSLRNRTGEAVEEGAVHGVGLREAVLDETDDDVVGDELTLVHHGLGSQTERGARLDGGTKHVARGDLGNTELFADELGLRALAGTGRPNQNQTHWNAPSIM